METVLSICIGIGLSAACGFRLFVPLLIMSIASLSGHLTLAHGFAWIGSYPALVAFAVATGLEVAAYYVPWIDNLIDTVATPAAIIAGSLVTASIITDFSPFLKWSLAIIAGGGAAGMVQGTTIMARGMSSVGTGGFGNPLIATAELAGSTLLSILAILAPLLALGLLLAFVFFFVKKLFQKRTKTRTETPA